MPESYHQGPADRPAARGEADLPRRRSIPFKKCGKSGQEIAEHLPASGTVADELCIIRSLHTEAINHDPAHTFMNTGTTISGRPSMGSWLRYGLGSESDNLPGFVVLTSLGRHGQAQPIAARQWHSGFLPSRFQGVEFRSKGDPVLYVNNPARRHTAAAARRGRRRAGAQPTAQRRRATIRKSRRASRSTRWPSACRPACRSLMDLSGEPKATLDLYGTQGRRRLVRGELPAGPAAGRARRAFHPALSSRLGPSRRHQAQHRR